MAHTGRSAASFTLTLGDRGRLVLPARVRKTLNLQGGERLILTVEEGGGLRLVRAREAAQAARGLLKDATEGRSLAQELIAERRQEAKREG